MQQQLQHFLSGSSNAGGSTDVRQPNLRASDTCQRVACAETEAPELSAEEERGSIEKGGERSGSAQAQAGVGLSESGGSEHGEDVAMEVAYFAT